MSSSDAEFARAWLADGGVRQVGNNKWMFDDEPDRELTKSDVALECSCWIVEDEHLDTEGRFRVAFGMVDLLDEYWTTQEMHFPYCGGDREPPPAALWDGFRERLEAPDVGESITASLAVTWFECRHTSEEAFMALLGRDPFVQDADEVVDDGFLRRAARVLEISGAVRWNVKARAYEAASRIEALHPAVFRALLVSYHGYFGDLKPGPALSLLDDLDLAPDTEHAVELRNVLAAGHRSHVMSPEAWAAPRRPTGPRPHAG